MNFLKNLNWVAIVLATGTVALGAFVYHEENDPVRNAALAKCQYYCGAHPIKNFYSNSKGTFQCDCEAYTRSEIAP
jgi:hypothetical protein